MRLAGKGVLTTFITGASEGEQADVRAWVAEIEQAQWSGSADIVAAFPNAQALGGNGWRFALARSGVVIDVQIVFRASQMIVGSIS